MGAIRTKLTAAVAVAILAVACSDSTGPGFDLTVTNNQDDFTALSVNVINESLDREYTWQNTGTRATATDNTIINGGVARIVIRDAVNAIVYDKALTNEPGAPTQNRVAGASPFENLPAAAVVEPTQTGVVGAWRIEILLSGFSGSVNARVQKL